MHSQTRLATAADPGQRENALISVQDKVVEHSEVVRAAYEWQTRCWYQASCGSRLHTHSLPGAATIAVDTIRRSALTRIIQDRAEARLAHPTAPVDNPATTMRR
jgi:hypothetical protein